MVNVQVRSVDPLAITAEDLLHRLGPEPSASYSMVQGDLATGLYAFLKAGSDFAVAFVEGQALGCAGYRKFPFEDTDTVAQLRMVFVTPDTRSRHVANALLRHLSEGAQRRGYLTFRVEVHENRPAALEFFEDHGFERVPKYGPFLDDPLVRCLEKRLL